MNSINWNAEELSILISGSLVLSIFSSHQLTWQKLNSASWRLYYYFTYSLQPPTLLPAHPASLPSCHLTTCSFLTFLSFQELKLPVYRAHSPQIGMRRYFADLLAILSNRYQLCPTARHLAVYLLDLFMDHYDVAVKQLYVIALSCLLLASKWSDPLILAAFLKTTLKRQYVFLSFRFIRIIGNLVQTAFVLFSKVCFFFIPAVWKAHGIKETGFCTDGAS